MAFYLQYLYIVFFFIIKIFNISLCKNGDTLITSGSYLLSLTFLCLFVRFEVKLKEANLHDG